MISELSAVVGWFGVGGVLLAFAYLIKIREWTFLIAGYDGSVTVPQKIAATIVGNFLGRVGVASFVIGIITAIPSSNIGTGGLSLVFAVVVAIDSMRVVYRLNTYENGSSY
jgi:hypothetical protein